MKKWITRVVPVDEANIKEAGRLIASGELVGFPTETVYGLGADALNADAVLRVFEAKGRPADNPLIVHVAGLSEISPLIAGEMPPVARRLADAFWPGPLTMIFPKSERVPSAVTAGLNTVAVRFPRNSDARALIRAAGTPIAAPSANASGRPSPTTAAHVFEDMDGKIPMILDGGPCEVGVESTVLDLTGTYPRVLRPGGVTPEMIEAVVGGATVDGSALRALREGEVARSPGMKYRHYAPKGDLLIVKGSERNVAEAICRRYDEAPEKSAILAFERHIPLYGERRVFSLGGDAGSAAQRLFAILREMDDRNLTLLYSEAYEQTGVGLAFMNRLGRAAGFHTLDAGD